MVRGLDLFQHHFADYMDHYVLIGGSACSLAFDAANVEFRATKDLDLVLTLEVLNDGCWSRCSRVAPSPSCSGLYAADMCETWRSPVLSSYVMANLLFLTVDGLSHQTRHDINRHCFSPHMR